MDRDRRIGSGMLHVCRHLRRQALGIDWLETVACHSAIGIRECIGVLLRDEASAPQEGDPSGAGLLGMQ